MNRTSLHEAVVDNNAELVQSLLGLGADPNAADDAGWTPLHFATQNYAVDVARLLIEAGANVDPKDAYGNTPLTKAVFNSEGRGEVISLLRAHGANPHAENARGVSPVTLARRIANFDVRQFFADLPDSADESESS